MLFLAADYWPVTLALLAAAGFALPRIARAWLRWTVAALLALSPLFALLFDGWLGGCMRPAIGEECMWFGFGLTLMPVLFLPVAIAAIGAGMIAQWLLVRRRRRQEG